MGDALFTGDHVMGWSTTVVVPPDGDMAAYMASLDKLRQRNDRIYYPGARAAGDQSAAICARTSSATGCSARSRSCGWSASSRATIPDIVANAYPGLDPRLVTAARRSVLAHLLDLERRGLVERRRKSNGQAA